MTPVSKTSILGVAALGALLGGCATTVETGPGYYHYDTRAAGSPPAIVHEAPAVVYQEPSVVYRDAPVVYSNPPVISTEPGYRYRTWRDSGYTPDHGQ